MSRFRAEAHSAVSRMCWRGILPSNSGGSTFRKRVWMRAPASGWLKKVLRKAVSRRDRAAVNETSTPTVATTDEWSELTTTIRHCKPYLHPPEDAWSTSAGYYRVDRAG